MSNFDAETLDRLQSTAMDRLLTPKKRHDSSDSFTKLCTFSPTINRPQSAKTLERLKTPVHERLFDKTTNAEKLEEYSEEANRFLKNNVGCTFSPVNSKESWDMMYNKKQ